MERNKTDIKLNKTFFDPLIMDRISDGVVALDKDWNYVFLNKQAGELLGRNPESLIGKHIWTEFPEGIGQPFHLLYEKAMETQEIQMLREFYPPWQKWFENRIYPSPDGLTIFFTDITNQVKSEELTTDELQRFKLYKTFLDHSNDSFQVSNIDGYLVFANEVALERLGFSEDQLNKVNVIDFEDSFHSMDDWRAHIDEMRLVKKQTFESTNTNLTTGQKINIEVTLSYEVIDDVEYIIAISRDISQRKEAELQIKKSIEEKESLLAEIHHRVKNNLAVVAGLMYLQTVDSENPELIERLSLNIDRIKSIAAIHEELYKSHDFSKINFANNIKKVVDNLQVNTYQNEQVSFDLKLDDIYLDIANALPATLILNELITNSFKHAFDGIDNPMITIELSLYDGRTKLVIADNGIGIDKKLIPNSALSMGLHLVDSLVTQLDAAMEFENKNGLTYTLLI